MSLLPRSADGSLRLPNWSVQAFLAVSFSLTTIVSWFAILIVGLINPGVRIEIGVPAELTSINAIVVGYYFGRRAATGDDEPPVPAPVSMIRE